MNEETLNEVKHFGGCQLNDQFWCDKKFFDTRWKFVGLVIWKLVNSTWTSLKILIFRVKISECKLNIKENLLLKNTDDLKTRCQSRHFLRKNSWSFHKLFFMQSFWWFLDLFSSLKILFLNYIVSANKCV